MTTDQFDTAIDTIRNLDNVRRVTVCDDGSRVAVSAGVDHDGSGYLCPFSEALFIHIEGRLFDFGFFHVDSEVDESDAGDFDAVEVWIFVRA